MDIEKLSFFISCLLTVDTQKSNKTYDKSFWDSFRQSISHIAQILYIPNAEKLWKLIEPSANTSNEKDNNSTLKFKASSQNQERLIEAKNEEEDDEMIPTTDIGTQTSFYLSEVDPMKMENDVILSNFCDQDERLVCLVCYKIFNSNVEKDLIAFKKHLSSHKKASLKKVKVLQRASRSESPSYSDGISEGKST